MRKETEAGPSKDEEMEEEDLFELDEDDEDEKKEEKKHKTGILFLPTIPPYMTVTILREMLGQFGEIGRVFLQEDPHVGAYLFSINLKISIIYFC